MIIISQIHKGVVAIAHSIDGKAYHLRAKMVTHAEQLIAKDLQTNYLVKEWYNAEELSITEVLAFPSSTRGLGGTDFFARHC